MLGDNVKKGLSKDGTFGCVDDVGDACVGITPSTSCRNQAWEGSGKNPKCSCNKSKLFGLPNTVPTSSLPFGQESS